MTYCYEYIFFFLDNYIHTLKMKNTVQLISLTSLLKHNIIHQK